MEVVAETALESDAPDDDALAWALASAAAPRLTRSHGNRINIVIGIGETLAAIDDLTPSSCGNASRSATMWLPR